MFHNWEHSSHFGATLPRPLCGHRFGRVPAVLWTWSHFLDRILVFLGDQESWLKFKYLPLLRIPGDGSGGTHAQTVRVALFKEDMLGQKDNDVHPEIPVTLNHGGGYRSSSSFLIFLAMWPSSEQCLDPHICEITLFFK